MSLRILKIFAAIMVVAGFSAAPAKAALVGTTVVNPTFDFAGAGLTPSGLGNVGTTSEGFLAFPITGGDLSAGLIEHENSGLRLTAGSTFVDLENFLIDISDPMNGVILADVTTSTGTMLNDAAILSFDLTAASDPFNLTNPTIELLFTAAASGLLDTLFGLGDPDALTGVRFGFAATAPSEVPLPAAAWLFIGGAGFLAAIRRRKAKSAA